EPYGDPVKSYRRGKLKFRLKGRRLHGDWTLAQMHGEASEDGKNWLLIKEKNDSISTNGRGPVSEEIPAEGRPAPLPNHFKPELATLVDQVPRGDGWIHEIKFDGYRLLCRV